MIFSDIFTVWVIRSNKPHLIGVANTKPEAVDLGNRTVSTKDFVIKVYGNKEITETLPTASVSALVSAPAPKPTPPPIPSPDSNLDFSIFESIVQSDD